MSFVLGICVFFVKEGETGTVQQTVSAAAQWC
jgi:hypothetical protein